MPLRFRGGSVAFHRRKYKGFIRLGAGFIVAGLAILLLVRVRTAGVVAVAMSGVAIGVVVVATSVVCLHRLPPESEATG